jgi:hypothetical protein
MVPLLIIPGALFAPVMFPLAIAISLAMGEPNVAHSWAGVLAAAGSVALGWFVLLFGAIHWAVTAARTRSA